MGFVRLKCLMFGVVISRGQDEINRHHINLTVNTHFRFKYRLARISFRIITLLFALSSSLAKWPECTCVYASVCICKYVYGCELICVIIGGGLSSVSFAIRHKMQDKMARCSRLITTLSTHRLQKAIIIMFGCARDWDYVDSRVTKAEYR